MRIKIKNDDVVPPEEESRAEFNNGNSHFIVDDHCYVLVNRYYGTDLFAPTAWIFGEALEILKTLPPLTPP